MSKTAKIRYFALYFLGLYFKGRVYLFINQLLLRFSFFSLLVNKDVFFMNDYSINFHLKKKGNIPCMYNLMKCAVHASAARAVKRLALYV